MTDNRADLAAAMMNAAIEHSRVDDHGVVLDPERLRQALAACMAMLIEADPDVRTPVDQRRAAEAMVRDLRILIRGMRDTYERTGRRAIDATVIRRQ